MMFLKPQYAIDKHRSIKTYYILGYTKMGAEITSLFIY